MHSGVKDVVVYVSEGENSEEACRWTARALAVFDLIQSGDIREPNAAEVEAKMGEAAKALGARAFSQ